MEPRKQAIIDALARFMNRRSGIKFGNYGDVKAFRAEQRSITKDLHQARTLLMAVARTDGIDADALLKAARSGFSGRLTINMEWGWQLVETDTRGKPVGIMAGFETEAEAVARLDEWKANKRPAADRHHTRPARNRAVIDYCTGQYFPTEYRRAVCAVLASALWYYTREHCMPTVGTAPCGSGKAEADKYFDGKKAVSAGDWLRAHFRNEFGRGIAARWFS